MNYELWIMNYELWIMNYELWIMNLYVLVTSVWPYGAFSSNLAHKGGIGTNFLHLGGLAYLMICFSDLPDQFAPTG